MCENYEKLYMEHSDKIKYCNFMVEILTFLRRQIVAFFKFWISILVGAFSFKEKSLTITVGSFSQLTISLGIVHFSYNSYNLTISYFAYKVVL